MSRWIRDIDPNTLRARAEQVDAHAIVVGGDLGATCAHLLRWLSFAPCPLYVLGTSRDALIEAVTLAAHAYDTPLGVARVHDRFEVFTSLESLTGRLVSASSTPRPLLYFHVERADGTSPGSVPADAMELALRAAAPQLALRRYVVVQGSGATDPQLFVPEADGARIELPKLLPPSSTRRSPERDGAAWSPCTPGSRVLPVDAAVLHLLEIANGEPGSAEPFCVDEGANPDMPATRASSLPRLAAEDLETYATAANSSEALIREEIATPRGPLLVTRVRGEREGREPLLLVNAYGVSSEVFEPLMLAAAERYWPLTYQSRAIPAWNEQALDALLNVEVEDLVAVLDEYSSAGCTLLGWCNGAPLALEAALHRPASIRRLILLSGVYPALGVPNTDYHRKLAQLLPTLSRSASACALYTKALYGSERAGVEPRESLPGQARMQHVLNRAFRTPNALLRYSHYYVQFWRDQALGSVASAEREHALNVLRGRVRLVVAPEDDIGPADASHALARKLGANVPRVAPSGGHYLLFEKPSTLLDLID